MIPIHLKLRGFRGIRAGLGLNEIDLDLSKLPHGLIAICGENGRGKTTILDSLHPYRLMPYKLRESDGWSTGAFSYYKQCFGRDALKELVWEMEGRRYKSVIMIDVERKSQEAYLYVETETGWSNYDNSVADGKTSAYDQAVESILGSPAMFFSTVFRSQKARELTAYSRGDILAIVCELLNVGHIKAQGEKAGAVVKWLESNGIQIAAAKSALIDLLEKKDSVQLELTEAEAYLTSLETTLRLTSDEKEGLTSRQRNMELAAAAETTTRQRLADLEMQRITTYTAKLESKGLVERITGQKKQDIEDAQSELAADVSAGNRQIREADNQIAKAQSVLSKKDEIQKAVNEVSRITEEIRAARSRKDALSDTYNLLTSKARESAALQSRIQEASSLKIAEYQNRQKDIQHLETEQSRCRSQLAILDFGLDCKADSTGWVNESCPLLADALKARDRELEIATLLVQLKDNSASIDGRMDYSTLCQNLSDLETEHNQAYSTLESETNDCINRGRQEKLTIEALDLELAKNTTLAEMQKDLDAAEATIKSSEATKLTVTENLQGRSLATKERVAAITKSRDETLEGINAQVRTHEKNLASLEQSIAVLKNSITEDVDKELKQIQSQIVSVAADMQNVSAAIKVQVGFTGSLNTRLLSFADYEKQVADHDLKLAKINAELIVWKVLAKAFSNDGIIALEVDDAGPSISSIANDLLNAGYGPRFSVRLETQAAKADGGLKETFDIFVFDSERDEEKSIREISGGEAVTVEDAIVRAFCIFNLYRSDKHYLTAFTDEKDGALSATRKKEFFDVKKKAFELGHLQQEFYITQTSELQDLAGSRIVLTSGNISIQ